MTVSVGHHSRMLSRMVLVLRFGSRVQEVTKSRCVCVREAFESVRKHSRVSRILGSRNGCEGQNCRHCWTRVWSSPLKSVSSYRDGESWMRSAELSSLLDWRLVLGSPTCQQSQGWGVLVAKRRTVVTFGLAVGVVLVVKRRTVLTFGLASGEERRAERREERGE